MGSDDEQIVDETVNEDISNENSENDVDMQSLPKGRSCLFFCCCFWIKQISQDDDAA